MEKIAKEFFISKSGKDLDDFVDVVFNHYRKVGFPYLPTNRGYRLNRYEDLMEADIDHVLQQNVINRTQHGISLAWSYFPHAFAVKCVKMITPIEAFNDDVMFKRIIRKVAKMTDGISDSSMRNILRLFSGVQAVSNFRPTAAAALYKHYAKQGVVWDMSGGWGGRLLGAVRANVEYYIATEPSIKTVKGLNELGNDFFKDRFKIEIKGSEVYKPQKNSLSMCFTSPPYFDLEKYADEPTQSFKKFSSKEQWVEGFLYETLANCYYGLKKQGYCLINIADPKKDKGISLEQETIKAAQRIGFKHVNTLVLVLKSPLGSGALLKQEPVFVFKK